MAHGLCLKSRDVECISGISTLKKEVCTGERNITVAQFLIWSLPCSRQIDFNLFYIISGRSRNQTHDHVNIISLEFKNMHWNQTSQIWTMVLPFTSHLSFNNSAHLSTFHLSFFVYLMKIMVLTQKNLKKYIQCLQKKYQKHYLILNFL